MITGTVIVLFFIFVAVFAEQLAPYDPHALGIPYLKPSPEHLLGTNDVGQDIFSELIFGTRVSLLIGVFTAVITTAIATCFGLLAGYYRGIADQLITGLTNIALSIPGLALTTLLVAYLKPGKTSLILAISITAWTGTARVLRAKVIQLCQLPFIKIEKTLGVRDIVIMVKHLIPNLKDIILTRMAMSVSSAMMAEAGLSFLGLGEYGEKSWGSTLHYAFYMNGVIRGYTWWYLPPILCTSLAVMGFMLIGYYGAKRRN